MTFIITEEDAKAVREALIAYAAHHTVETKQTKAVEILDKLQRVEVVGYMNAGHVYELQQKRIPYGYVYQDSGVGAEVRTYAVKD